MKELVETGSLVGGLKRTLATRARTVPARRNSRRAGYDSWLSFALVGGGQGSEPPRWVAAARKR